MNKLTKSIASLVVASFFALSGTSVALASPTVDNLTDKWVTAKDVDDSHASVESGKIRDALAAVQNTGDKLVFESDTANIAVPKDPSEGLAVSFAGTNSFDVQLPEVAGLKTARLGNDGKVVYEGVDNVATSVIPVQSGVQVVTTIANREAPTVYAYKMSLPEGVQLSILADGGVEISSSTGDLLSYVAAPWAYDADGKPVPTHYEINGDTLTQVVDHTSGNVAYPVVSDPFWFTPFVLRCLTGLGLNGPTIANIIAAGTPMAIIAAGGYAALRCVMGR